MIRDALQQAINKVQETTNQGILFIPAGRYRLTKTIYIWPGIRLIGFGASGPHSCCPQTRPVFSRALPTWCSSRAAARGRMPPMPPHGTQARALSILQ